MKSLWRNKWFILVTVGVLFFFASGAKVMAAGGDSQLAQILQAGLDGLNAFFDWLLSVLNVIWQG